MNTVGRIDEIVRDKFYFACASNVVCGTLEDNALILREEDIEFSSLNGTPVLYIALDHVRSWKKREHAVALYLENTAGFFCG